MCKLVSHASSTRTDYNKDMRRITKDPCVTFSAAEEAGLITREIGALRQELSVSLSDAPSRKI